MKKVSRVLHVVGKMHYGGMETLIMNLYRNIDRNKLQFDFMVHYYEKGDYDDEIRELGGKIYNMPRTQLTNYFVYKKKIYNFFREHNDFVAVHVHLHNVAFIVLREAKKYGMKCIEHLHNSGVENNLKGMIGYATTKIGFKYADYIFSCSNVATQFYLGNKTNNDVIILKNGIDLKRYSFDIKIRNQMREKYNVRNKYVILHVGRFCQQKNHDFLIEIYKNVTEKNNASHLFLIGDGPLKEIIKMKVERLQLSDNVTFLEKQDNIHEWMMMADCFLFPSLYEGLGIVLIEAQAADLKCVVSTGVPREAMLTKKLDFVSLLQKKEEWTEMVLREAPRRGTSCLRQISDAGYDIVETAKWLEEWYLKN